MTETAGGSNLGGTEDFEESSPTHVPVSRLRRAVAKTMTASAAVPQFSIDRDIYVGELLNLRTQLPDTISVADLFHAAIARAATGHPRVNASWLDDKIVEYAEVNLGVTVAVQDGLLVPAIDRADSLSLRQLSTARKYLAHAAATDTLRLQQLASATITVSNIGPSKATGIRPMVIPPQSSIIGIPGPKRSGFTTFTITCDHRVLDGLTAAEYLATLAASIEDPAWFHEILN